MTDYYGEYKKTADAASKKMLDECLNPSIKESPYPYQKEDQKIKLRRV